MKIVAVTIICLMIFAPLTLGWAAEAKAALPDAAAASGKLQACLKRVDDLPDMAAAEAEVWIKKGGGDAAHMCRAFAQANRGMHEDAAREFWALASVCEKSDTARAATMHNLSGGEFMAAKQPDNAAAQFTLAIRLTPNDSDAWLHRAEARMQTEQYWEAIDDLNAAVKIRPDDIDALRQRGRAWMQLGNDKNAQEDLAHAAILAGDKPDADPPLPKTDNNDAADNK